LFEHLAWAGYVKPKRNPPAGKQPVAYIVVLTDPAKSPERACLGDAAAAIENILLAAWSLEIGSCWLGAINRDEIKKLLAIRSELYIDSVLALGYPAENPIMEEAKAGSTQYYLDENDTLHVPKRPLSEIAHFNSYGRK
jgi:nitroreductase